jgi:hypothetical protein
MQGHVSRTCPKKTNLPTKAAATTVVAETPKLSKAQTEDAPLAMTQDMVLNYLKNLSSDEYQNMAEAWGKMSGGEDFGQA